MLPYIVEYERELAAHREKRNALDARIRDKQDKIDRLQEKISRLAAQKQRHVCPNWVDAIVRPLADDLAAHTGKHAHVLGPFGLRAEVCMHLTDTPDADLITTAYDYITLVPDVSGDIIKMHYDTGRVIRECVPGSIGELNHCGNETLPLPDTIEGIVRLLGHHKGMKARKDS